MREVAKSVIGFSWAVSLFGVQQISKVLSTTQPVTATTAELDEVTRAVQGHLFGAAAMQFRAADQWTRNLVDVVFDAATGQSLDAGRIVDALDPRKMMDVDPRAWADTSVTLFHQSVDAVKQAVTPSAS